MELVKTQNVQLVLYFDVDIRSKIINLCSEFTKDDEAVRPMILPFDQGPFPPADMPLAIVTFGNIGQLQICASLVSISTLNIDNAMEIGKKVIRIFKKCDFSFYRIGVISGYAFPNEKISIIKEEMFQSEAAPSLDFSYARFITEPFTKSINANVWKKYFTNTEATPDLLAEFDINTLITEKHEIDEKFFVAFLVFTQEVAKKHLGEDHVL